jgi:CheY-like chemotaxis protein
MNERRRILLVEDDESFRAMMCELLNVGDYYVREASNSEDALALAENEKFDLAITDLLMPGEGGFKFIRKMRQLHPSVKIIAMSGGDNKTDADDCLFLAGRFRADVALRKPFRMEDLMSQVILLLK